MGKINIIAFDKTGTLTHGNLTVSDILTFDDTVTASAEACSEHPLGKAIVKYAVEQRTTLRMVETFSMVPGKALTQAWTEIFCCAETPRLSPIMEFL